MLVMVATLLEDDQSEFYINVDELHSLEETGFEDATEVREARPLDDFTVETLFFSNPRVWPPIFVTKTDIGYVVIDGNHRWEAARQRPLEQIRATSRTFKSADEVIEAAYTANLTHGKPASKENRSSYARWLHKKFPKLTQKDIGKRAGISQATVSEALARPTPQVEPKQPEVGGKRKAPVPGDLIPTGTQPEEEQRRRVAVKDWKTFMRDAKKIMEDTKDLDERMQRAAAMEALTNIADRDALLILAHFIEEILEPPKPPARRRPTKKTEEPPSSGSEQGQ
jgi:ParB-like chromosome segregation protein Spo0J